MQGGIDAVQELADRDLDPGLATLLYDKLERACCRSSTRADEDTFLQAVLSTTCSAKASIARTGQNLAASQYDQASAASLA